jgi:hypothetical protein
VPGPPNRRGFAFSRPTLPLVAPQKGQGLFTFLHFSTTCPTHAATTSAKQKTRLHSRMC